jgi:4-hydroxythreonine-4-phosphate dehydrogenase
VEKIRAGGIVCDGPIPSDTIFLKALRGEYDGVVMMYHDQGQIATKLLGFNKGVTVTAGLKTVFTTPAHGTAFDIVGKGKADPGALEHALRLAVKLATARPQRH